MESHIDIWSLMRTLAHCNGEGCHSYLPNCPDYADCKVDSDRILEFIEALIASEQKPMVEALKEAKKDLETIQGGEGPYNRNPLTHLENCYEHMIEIARKSIAKIDAVLPKGGVK